MQGLSVADLEARMLYQQQDQQQRQVQPQSHAQNNYNQSSSGLYSPSAAAALARLTQSTQQSQPQSLQSMNRNDAMLQSVLANQLQQRQASPANPAYLRGGL